MQRHDEAPPLTEEERAGAFSNSPDNITHSSGLFRYSKNNFDAGEKVADLLHGEQIKKANTILALALLAISPTNVMNTMVRYHNVHRVLPNIVNGKIGSYVYHDERETGEKMLPFVYFFFFPSGVSW